MSIRNKNIYVLAPIFFGYEKDITSELVAKNNKVSFYDERPFNSTLGKIILRLNVNLLARKHIENYYNNIFEKLSIECPDYLFLVNPESISPNLLRKVREISPNTKIIIYMWDSAKNKKNSIHYINEVDKFITFDCEDRNLSPKIDFLPLFYTRQYQTIDKNQSVYENTSCFIGTAHSDRVNLMEAIVDKIGEGKHYNYIYCQSKLIFFVRKIFTKQFTNIKFRDVKFSPIDKVVLLKEINKSKVVIDISHPAQNGLTMRTIEMLGARRKLITTNKNVVGYDFYNAQNILVIDRDNPKIDLNFLEHDYKDIDENIYNRYSLSSWLDNVFKDV